MCVFFCLCFLVGGFNPSEKMSNWIIFPRIGVNIKTYWTPPPSFCLIIFSKNPLDLRPKKPRHVTRSPSFSNWSMTSLPCGIRFGVGNPEDFLKIEWKGGICLDKTLLGLQNSIYPDSIVVWYIVEYLCALLTHIQIIPNYIYFLVYVYLYMIFKCNYDTNTKETMIHRIWLHLEYVINSRVIYHRTEQQHIHPCRDISIQILPARIDEQRGRCHHRLAWWNRSLSHRWKTWDFEQIQFGFSHLIEHRNQSPQWKFCTRLSFKRLFSIHFSGQWNPMVFHEKTSAGEKRLDRQRDLSALWRCVLGGIHVLCKTLPSCKAPKQTSRMFFYGCVPRSRDPNPQKSSLKTARCLVSIANQLKRR